MMLLYSLWYTLVTVKDNKSKPKKYKEKEVIIMTNGRDIYSSTQLLQAKRTQAQRRRARAQRRNTVIATSCCVITAAASFVVLGVTLMKINSNNRVTPVKTSFASQLAQNSNGAATAEQDAIAQQTQSENNSVQDIRQNTPGTHHSGAVWDGTGAPLHISATGRTSYGYDWTYEDGGGIVEVGCDYTFDSEHYDFSIIGKEPGTASITIYYHTDTDHQSPITVSFTVDSNLVVTPL